MGLKFLSHGSCINCIGITIYSGQQYITKVFIFGVLTWMMDPIPYPYSIRGQLQHSMVKIIIIILSYYDYYCAIINIVDIAIDWITDKLYWTNTNQIMVYDLHTGYQTIIINSTESDDLFYQILVDPIARYLQMHA